MKDSTESATVSPRRPVPSTWKEQLRTAIRDPGVLLRRIALPESLLPEARRTASLFPLLVTESFLRRIRPGDRDDPLLRQVLPLGLEEVPVAGFERDPVGDAAAGRAPGLVQKYRGRALLLASPLCAIHCRYCFRRHFPYATVPRDLEAWKTALETLRSDESIGEVILSGGDPLMLTDSRLGTLLSRLEAIPHLRRLRIHTRLPVAIPCRITAGLLDRISSSRLAPWFVVHVNHPREVDAEVAASFLRIVEGGIPVLNQAVLLRGVNDSAETLAELCERLVDLRVTPYYLHQLDPVAGAAHFRVPEERGVQLHRQLRRRLPGYALPRYVKEVPGEPHKVEIAEVSGQHARAPAGGDEAPETRPEPAGGDRFGH